MKLFSSNLARPLLGVAIGILAAGFALPAAARSSSASLSADSQQALEASRDAWLEESSLTLGRNSDGSWVYFGSATIESAPSPSWGAARLAAFEQAESEARASFVERTGISVTTESISSLFQDDSAFEELLKPRSDRGGDALRRIEARLLELEGPELLRALELLGLDRDGLARLDEPQRRVALREAFEVRVATRAARQLRGLRVLQTFESSTEDTYSVGVLLRWSEQNARLAEVVRSGRGSIAGSNEGKPLEEWLPQTDAELVRDWGVRVFPDPQGEPLVVCFAQAAVGTRPEDPPRAREARRRAAALRAKALAQRDLTHFINATTVVEQLTTEGEQFEIAMELFPDGSADHDPGSSSVASAIDRTIRTQGRAVIVGGEVARSWRATLPGRDEEFCGVVYAWSPTRARLALGQPDKPPTPAESEAGQDYPVDF